MSKDVSIVVPVYNSESTLRELHQRLSQTLKGFGYTFEVILVDDCSPDNSWQSIKALAESDSRIIGLSLMRNYGQAASTLAGMQASTGNIIITIDDDLQNPPEEIPKLINALGINGQYDVAIGVPREKKHSAWRNWASHIVTRVTRQVFSSRKSVTMTSFRAMRRQVVEPLFSLNTPEPAPGVQLFNITQKMVSVPVDHHPRKTGASGYTLAKMVRLTNAKFLGYTAFPLRAMALAGLLGVVVSILLGLYFLTRYLLGEVAVPGWTTIVLLLLFTSGFNFLALGVIGEYLFQIFKSARHTPAYIVRENTVADKSPS